MAPGKEVRERYHSVGRMVRSAPARLGRRFSNIFSSH